MNLAENRYITRTQLAEELGLSIPTIRNWSRQDNFPRPLPNSGKVPIYHTSKITSWLEGLNNGNA
jgi:predicted DNA-binding transcriptional regulator AlpA